jgi:hypothetical protein
MGKRQKISMILLITVFGGLFAYSAYYLWFKQSISTTITSFTADDEERAILFNDIDRLCNKVIDNPEAIKSYLPDELYQGLLVLAKNDGFSFNDNVSERLYFSQGSNGYILVLENAELRATHVLEMLQENFTPSATLTDNNRLILGENEYYLIKTGNFLAVSTQAKVRTKQENSDLWFGNADYVVFGSDGSIKNHILSRDFHFTLWREDLSTEKSRAVSHESFFTKIPAEFEEVYFWGGSRFQEDVPVLFESPSEELFSWMNEGMLLLRKSDSMEILLSKQNEERDLRMILEEQTAELNYDSAHINTFNIGSFEVMHFKTRLGWHQSIPELKNRMTYYAEHDNFNVVANSLPAMRWFLAGYQQDDFFLANEVLRDVYARAIPEKLNYLKIVNTGEGINILTSINSFSEKIYTSVNIMNQSVSNSGDLELITDFPVEIIPTTIQTVGQGLQEEILLNNQNQLALYSLKGELRWRLDLSSSLVSDPVTVDFENDGVFEYVLFQQAQLDVILSDGKSKDGFPVKLQDGSDGGAALNYDMAYNFRLLVSNGNQLQCYNEDGKSVMGWMFKGMKAGLDGPVEYWQVDGKDYICFKDKMDNHYRLNRRGENRFKADIKKSLRNENDYLFGTNESNLRKMGYSKQYIYSYYIKDGKKDSTKVDLRINPTRILWKMQNEQPVMIADEPDRTLTFDNFGYKKSEILKESSEQEILDVFGTQDFFYLFFDSPQNKLYLRDSDGQLLTGKPIKGSRTSTLIEGRLITFVGNKIKVYKLN